MIERYVYRASQCWWSMIFFRKVAPTFRDHALVALGTAVLGAAAGFAAAPSGPIDIDNKAGTIVIEPDNRATAGSSARDQLPSGNPLWAIPLKELSATRERPLFSTSRRPPPPAVVAAPYVPAAAVSKPAEPDRPRLSLVGTISGTTDGFGIFLDQTNNLVVKLRTGEGHRGWILRRVVGREVTFQKDREMVSIALPAANTQASAAPQLAGDRSGGRGRR